MERVKKSSCLVKEQLPALLPAQVHHLHGHLSTAMLLAGDADHARRALPDLHEVLQVAAWVSPVHHQLQGSPELLVADLRRVGAGIRGGALGAVERGRAGTAGVRGGGARRGRAGLGLTVMPGEATPTGIQVWRQSRGVTGGHTYSLVCPEASGDWVTDAVVKGVISLDRGGLCDQTEETQELKPSSQLLPYIF